jgi:hypothetical protein|tara:strand:+ start:5787 stop:5951 length:165 start_codon:yes stop_codon:yes gene_type:complete
MVIRGEEHFEAEHMAICCRGHQRVYQGRHVDEQGRSVGYLAVGPSLMGLYQLIG